MSAFRTCCDPVSDGTRVRVRVSPRAKRTEAAGTHGDALRVRVAAPPADGKANAALLGWLAGALGVPGGDVRLVRGHSGRDKVVAVDGLVPDEVAARLARA